MRMSASSSSGSAAPPLALPPSAPPPPSRPQSTFRSDRFNIRYPSEREAPGGIVDEALYLLRRHFLNRHLFSEAVWDRIRHELTAYSDPNAAVSQLMSKFDDPYTRFIPVDAMSKRANVIRGERGSCGIELCRVWNWQLGVEVLFRRPVARVLSRLARLGPVARLTADWQPPVAAPWPQTQTDGGQFWFYLGAALDTVCPLLMAAWAHLQPGIAVRGSSGLALRRFGAACLLTALVCSARRWALPVARPWQVTAVTTDDARLAGIRAGDVVLSVEGQDALRMDRGGLLALIDGGEGGEIGVPVQLGLLRGGGEGADSVRNDATGREAVLAKGRRSRLSGLKLPRLFLFGRAQNSPPATATATATATAPAPVAAKRQSQYLELNVTRQAALLPKVAARLLPEAQGAALGYLCIEEFTDNTLLEVRQALHALELDVQARETEKKMKNSQVAGNATVAALPSTSLPPPPPLQSAGSGLSGLVIDLRGNPGGPLGSALDVAALFLAPGTVLTQILTRGGSAGRQRAEKHTSLNRDTPHYSNAKSLPILLLTDGDTASASEILVASLCEHKRAASMGRTTVGKNLAQAIMMLSDGSGLAFTVAEYLTPGGRSMAGGLVPGRVIFERDLRDLVGHIEWRGGDAEATATGAGDRGRWHVPTWMVQSVTGEGEAEQQQKQRVPMLFGLSHLQ